MIIALVGLRTLKIKIQAIKSYLEEVKYSLKVKYLRKVNK